MRSNRLLIPAGIVAFLLLSACSARSAPLAIEASCDDFTQAWSPVTASASIRKSAAVAVDSHFTVTLCVNPGTGYQWETPKIADPSVVQQVDHRVEAPRTPRPGAPGKETWEFKALKPGTTTLTLDYSRPWSGGEKATWKFVLDVTAR